MALSLAGRVSQFARTVLASGGDAAAVRTALGQKEVTIDDRIIGANTASFDVSLQGYRSLRLRYELYLPTSVAATRLSIRVSADGTTFDAGASDYYAGWDYSIGATPAGSAGAASAAPLSPQWQAGQSTEVVIQGNYDLFAGASGKRFSWSGTISGINTDSFIAQIGGRRQSAGAKTHIRIMADDGSQAIGAGSRFTLIGMTPP